MPTNSVGGVPFPCIFDSIFCCLFLMISFLTGVRWNSNIVLIVISLMANDHEYFFMNTIAICTSYFEYCLLICPFINWLFVLLLFNILNSLCNLSINLLSHEQLAKIFSHSVGCLLILVIVPLMYRTILIWWSPIYQYLPLFPGQFRK
jgi:hypothetical protein